MAGTWLRRFAVCMISAAALQAMPPLTTIQDVLYKANGTLFDGVAQIEWEGFQASDGTQVPRNSLNIRVVRGQLRVALAPMTDAISAPQAWYIVRFSSEGRTQFVEYWAVPPSASPLRLRQVRIATPGNAANLTSSVNIADVLGLRTELDLRPGRGPGWTPNRTAVIGFTGALEAAAGSPDDCVRVDGTSGPCGTTMYFVDGETPAGSVNGTNATFRLSGEPNPPESLRLYRNGILLNSNLEYSLSGSVVTMSAARVPASGDVLQAWYRLYGSAGAVVDGETPAGSVDGLNAVFTLAAAPVPAASLQIYRNGLLQKAGVDYSLSANVITFWPFSLPTPGDILQASYRK